MSDTVINIHNNAPDAGVVNSTPDINAGISIRSKFLKILRGILYSFSTLGIISFILIFTLYLVPIIQELSIQNQQKLRSDPELRKDPVYKKQIQTIKKDIQKLSYKFNALTPENPYIVINTTKNKFYLYRNKKMIRQGFCSSGSYILLMTEEAEKQWVFKTPKGRFRIQGKTTSPVWRRPDWSFVEEGLPIPSSNDPSRWEYGVLGDYALSIGDGYLIHGTIYKRFLGMPVTHGCIRLNDEDLEAIYKTLDFGSKVYIY